MSDPALKGSGESFTTTKWTVVIGVIQNEEGEAARAALEAFCRQYRSAIYGFIRRRGYPHERAEDLVQEFLQCRILEKWPQRDTFVHRANKTEGRFRSFFSHVLIRFLQDKARADGAVTVGGTYKHVSAEVLAETGQVLPGAVDPDIGRQVDLEFASLDFHATGFT